MRVCPLFPLAGRNRGCAALAAMPAAKAARWRAQTAKIRPRAAHRHAATGGRPHTALYRCRLYQKRAFCGLFLPFRSGLLYFCPGLSVRCPERGKPPEKPVHCAKTFPLPQPRRLHRVKKTTTKGQVVAAPCRACFAVLRLWP